MPWRPFLYPDLSSSGAPISLFKFPEAPRYSGVFPSLAGPIIFNFLLRQAAIAVVVLRDMSLGVNHCLSCSHGVTQD